MNSFRRKFLVLLLPLLAINSCSRLDDAKNPLDGFKLYINYDIFDTFIAVRFIDTATNELINDTDVEATIGGQHSAAIVDQLGNNDPQYTSVFGLMSLALNPKDPYVPSTDNPIQFSMSSATEGYQDLQSDFEITETGIHYFDIYLESDAALTQGFKKYTRTIPLLNSALIDSFSLTSGAGEFKVMIPKDVKVLTADNETVPDTFAIAELIIYNKINKAPVAHNLVLNSDIDGEISQRVYNPVSIISFSVKTETADIRLTENGEIDFSFGLNSNYINPETGNALSPGDKLSICQYKSIWVQESVNTIESNDDSLSLGFTTNHLSVFSVGVFQQVCDFSGNIAFTFTNEFLSEPVGTRVSCYRVKDNKYISATTFNLDSQNLSGDFNFKVPENDAVKLLIRQKSNANGFKAAPANINVPAPCNGSNNYSVDLSSTSVKFEGEITFNFTEPFANEAFNVRVNFHDADNGNRLIVKTYNISDGKMIQIDTGIPEGRRLALRFSASNQDNAFTTLPGQIIVDDPTAPNQSWSVDLIPSNCTYSGNLDLNYSGSFTAEQLDIRLIIIDKSTNSTYKEDIISFEPQTNLVPFSIYLPKTGQYRIQLMRTGTGQIWQVYPYEFDVDQTCSQNATLSLDLGAAVEQFTTFNVTVVCPTAEILPTLQGFYRTIWDEDWLDAEIVDGHLEKVLELNATYEIGLIIDNKMKVQEYEVTDLVNEITYELDDDDCDEMGW